MKSESNHRMRSRSKESNPIIYIYLRHDGGYEGYGSRVCLLWNSSWIERVHETAINRGVSQDASFFECVETVNEQIFSALSKTRTKR
jgi:hypothetical protein